MTELEKIEYTKGFVDKLAEGINPIDGTPIAEGDLLNNVRISRCMYYVSDILRRVIENGGIEGKKPAKRGRAPFALSDSARRGLIPADEPLRISQVTSLINEKVDPEAMKNLRSGVITRWLLGIGALEEVQLPSGKETKLPTPQGRSLTDLGVTPDVEIEYDDETYAKLYYSQLEDADDTQLQAALRILTDKIS